MSVQTFFEIASSAITLSGALVLTWDALWATRRVEEAEGARTLMQLMEEAQSGTITTSDGNQIRTEYDLRMWFARSTRTHALIGFSLLTSGFLMSLIEKVFAAV